MKNTQLQERKMTSVSLQKIKKSYGSVEVIHGVDLEIKQGEFVVFVGPSGCGKSTLLRMIAGLEKISDGVMYIGDQLVNNIPPSQRGIAMVFQSYALYPHMTVYDNMAFGMRIANASKVEIEERINSTAEILQLEDYLDRLPKALSGGQRQRVAIGRAICRNPQVFLFDEPLSNLDAGLRVATRIEIAKLKESMPDTTMVYVTHDQVEAMTLADRIVVLSAGEIEQVGAPIELYERPSNLFVAKFIGSPAMNILSGVVSVTGKSTTVIVDGNKIKVPIASPASLKGQKISLGVRPEDLGISKSKKGMFSAKVIHIESLGETTNAFTDNSACDEPIVVKLQGIQDVPKGSVLQLDAELNKLHLFDSNGQSLLYY